MPANMLLIFPRGIENDSKYRYFPKVEIIVSWP